MNKKRLIVELLSVVSAPADPCYRRLQAFPAWFCLLILTLVFMREYSFRRILFNLHVRHYGGKKTMDLR